MSIPTAERRLIALGALLVLLAMLTGALIGQFPDVELLLSAHVAASLSGTLMIAVGGAMQKLVLTDRARGWLVWTLAGSGYLNLVGALLGAAWGTDDLTPVHGAGTAGPGAEQVVGAVLAVMVVCTLASLGLLLRGALASEPTGARG